MHNLLCFNTFVRILAPAYLPQQYMNDQRGGDIDLMLLNLFRPPESLRELFDQRVGDLKITQTQALEILGLEHRALNGILQGTQKRADYTNLIKLASFLQLPVERTMQLYVEALEKNFPDELKPSISPAKIQFIKENFDLAALKKVGFIDSITDYGDIDAKVTSYFGFQSIEEYERPEHDVAFSAGLIEPKSPLLRAMWIRAANKLFTKIANPNPYNRGALVDFFPTIRWHSIDVETGMVNVIRQLYRLGVTIVYQPSLASLHLRGATFAVHEKPCIVLTNYRGFYPTLWFALAHELFHVLFDWDEIVTNSYHLSDEIVDRLSLKEKETEADGFARKYLFSQEKSEAVRPHLRDENYVRRFAEANHVHPSFVYVFNAYDQGHRPAWAMANFHNPQDQMADLLKKLENPWNKPKAIADFARKLGSTLYR